MPPLPPPASPPTWRDRGNDLRARLGPDLRRVVVAAGSGAAAVVLAALALVAWRGSPPAPEVTLPRVGSPGDPGSGMQGPPGGVGGPAGEEILVHAAGAVGRPGVYRVAPQARVADVLDAAGGPAAGADLDQLNLAARVTDGERLYVAREGETVPAPTGPASGGAGSAGDGRPVDLNTATPEELDTLPGVGPSTAAAIVEYRREHGRFATVDDLLDVPGIGPAKLDRLRSKVRA